VRGLHQVAIGFDLDFDDATGGMVLLHPFPVRGAASTGIRWIGNHMGHGLSDLLCGDAGEHRGWLPEESPRLLQVDRRDYPASKHHGFERYSSDGGHDELVDYRHRFEILGPELALFIGESMPPRL
jgi:hypothetical protein